MRNLWLIVPTVLTLLRVAHKQKARWKVTIILLCSESTSRLEIAYPPYGKRTAYDNNYQRAELS